MSCSVRIIVRHYEIDTQGHLNAAVYHQYAEHARWETFRAAGIPGDRLLSSGVGPVQLEATVKFAQELRGGDEVEVTCDFIWGTGKTFRTQEQFLKPDGTRAAVITSSFGLLDLAQRRLITDPAAHLEALATDLSVLNL